MNAMYLETLIRRAQANPKLVEAARKWLDCLIPLRKVKLSGEVLALTDLFPILREAILDRAYNVAAYVLEDPKCAQKVALDVATSLEVPYEIVKEASTSNDKSARTYKVKEFSLLLDQLIFKKTTVHERLQELEHTRGGRQLTEEAMIIRFIKKIMEHSISHNTFYTVVGLHRVLFNYPVHEARMIYQILAPCADAKKPGADDFRHHKKRIMDILERRFEDFAEVVEYGEQNEHRFKKRFDSHLIYPLVEQTLDLLTPALPDCPLISGKLENIDDVKRSLYSHASIEENEDNNLKERNRMHMLTHLSCFSRLQALLGLASTKQVLEIPVFNMTNNGGSSSPPFDRQNIPPLTTDDKKRMYAELDRRQKRSKKMPLEKVQVIVDDVERSTLSLDEARPAIFELEEGAGVIEFRGNDEEGGLPLGMHSLSWDESTASDEPESYRMTMRGGRVVKFSIAHTRDDSGALIGAKVVCSYSKVRQSIIILPSLRQIREWLLQLRPRSILSLLRLKSASALIGILAFGTVLYLSNREPPSSYVHREGLEDIAPLAPAGNADLTQPQQIIGAHPENQAKSQVAQLREQARPATQIITKIVKPSINATVTIRASGELITTDYSIPPLPTLSQGKINKAEVSSDPSGVFASGTEVITLPVTERSFVKITELPRANGLANRGLSTFLVEKRVFIKPFANNTLSQDVYVKLVKDLQASNYIISQQVSGEAVVLEGKIVKNDSEVTLSLLLNNSDGSLICLKSVSSRNSTGDETSVVADLSAKAVKSLSEEREQNTYVAVDYYLSQTTHAQSQSAIKQLNGRAENTMLDSPEIHSATGHDIQPEISAGL
jgi:hypothetical protein